MEFSKLQRVLDFSTKALAAITTELRVELKPVPKEAERLILLNLSMTADNANTDSVTLQQQIKATLAQRDALLGEVAAKNVLPELALWSPNGEEDYQEQLNTLELKDFENEDAASLRELILRSVKGIAQMCFTAYEIGYEDEGIAPFVERILLRTLKYNLSIGLLFNMALEVGGYAYRAMNLVDRANANQYGEGALVNVPIGVRKNPGILVCGTNFSVLQKVLEATQDQGVDVYTHDNLFSAYDYPELRKYPHFAGNYGGSMKQQEEDFTSFHGPIVVTAGGLTEPKEGYKDRLYTTLPVFFPGIPDVKDFAAVVEQAKTCEAPEVKGMGEIIAGFNEPTLEKMKASFVGAMQDGTMKKLVVFAGCAADTNYVSEFCRALPQTAAVMTVGSIKYQAMNLGLGTLRGMPRVMDAGGIHDLYAILSHAMKFQADLDKYDINGVPMTYVVSFGNALSYAAFLAIVYMGIKDFYILERPDFISDAVFGIFQKNFKLKTVTTAQEDVDALFKEKAPVTGTVDMDMLIIDIIERWPDSAEILMSCGMSCVTCGSALYESLSEACMVHGLDPEDVKEVLDHELGLVEDDD